MSEEIKIDSAQADITEVSTTVASGQGNKSYITYDVSPVALLKVVGTAVSVWLVIRLFPVLILVVFSLMLVATFNPLVRRMERKLGRSWAIMGVVTFVIVLFLGILAAMIPTLINEALILFQKAPQYAHQLEQILAAHRIHINIQKQVEMVVTGSHNAPLPVFNLLGDLATGITGFVTVAILSIYLLIEGPQVSTQLMRLLPHNERVPVRKLLAEIGTQVGGYMRGQILTSGLAGIFSFAILWVVGVPGAFALGALAAIADAIPLIGLLIALIPAALMALTVSPGKAGIVIIGYLLYHQLEDHLIAPKVYGKALSLSLTAIVISMLIGVQLMGMTGAILALPAAAVLRSVIGFLQELYEKHIPSENAVAVEHPV
jgi:predicted PurR-regulated permease PerM